MAGIRRLDGERRDAGGGVGQVQFGFFGQAERVVRAEVEHAVFEDQGQGVAHIGPPGFHLAIGDFQGAFGRDRHQADVTLPVDLPAFRAGGDQGHVGIVFRQGAEVFQLEVEFVVEELDRLAGAQVFKVQITARQLDPLDPQRERFGVGVCRCRFAGWQFEQLRQVQLAGLVEQQLGLGFVELHIGQVQGAGPQAVELQVGVEPLETHLFLAGIADLEAPQRHFQAERVELDTLDAGRHRGVVGQLLVGYAKGNAGQNQKAQQAVQGNGSQQGASGANQSFGHGAAPSMSNRSALEYGTGFRFRRATLFQKIPITAGSESSTEVAGLVTESRRQEA